MSKPEEKFLFLDLETTGLRPDRCRIIECACILTGPDFVPLYEFESGIVDVAKHYLDPCWEHTAYQMHRANGLLELVRVFGTPESIVREGMYDFLSKAIGRERVNLAGNSVHFDRSMLAERWPEVLGFLTHRHLDVSSLRLVGKAAGATLPEQPRTHRAMDDVRASIEELKYWIKPGAFFNAEMVRATQQAHSDWEG